MVNKCFGCTLTQEECLPSFNAKAKRACPSLHSVAARHVLLIYVSILIWPLTQQGDLPSFNVGAV